MYRREVDALLAGDLLEIVSVICSERNPAPVQGYLAGDRLTLVDVRLFPTLIRFDECYYTTFKCNKEYLHQYNNLWPYLRDLYQTPGFAETVRMEQIKDDGYYQGEITPIGPRLNFEQPHERNELPTAGEPTAQTP